MRSSVIALRRCCALRSVKCGYSKWKIGAMDDCSKRKDVMRVHPIRGHQSGPVSSFLIPLSLPLYIQDFSQSSKTTIAQGIHSTSSALRSHTSGQSCPSSPSAPSSTQPPRSSSISYEQAANPHRYSQHGHHIPNISLPPRAQSRTQRRAHICRHARLGHPVRPAQQGTPHHVASFLPPPHLHTSRPLTALLL